MKRASMRDLLAVETTKLLRQPSTWVVFGILVGYLALLVFGLATVLRAPTSSGIDTAGLLKPLRADAVGFVANIGASIGTILLVVLAAQSIAQEFSRATLRTMLVSRAERAQLALAKLLVLLVVCVVVAIVVTLGALAAAGVFEAVTGEDLLHATAASALSQGLRVLAALAVWTTISFGTTLWARSLGVGLGSTLGGLIAGDILTGMLKGLGQAGVIASRVIPNAAVTALTDGKPLDAVTVAWVAANLAVWVVGTNAYAVAKLRRTDVIAATK